MTAPALIAAGFYGAVEANLAAARRAYKLWNIEGFEALLEQVWAPSIVFYEAAELPDADVFHGADAFADHARDLIEAMGHFQWKVRLLEGRDAFYLAELEVRGEGASSGATVTTRLFHVGRWKAGRLAELRSYLDGARARAEYERLSSQSD